MTRELMTGEEIVASHVTCATTLLSSTLKLEEVVDLLAMLLVVRWLIWVVVAWACLFHKLSIANFAVTGDRSV